ncbi:hypothetical protein CSZ94_17345 [Janthinobacterium sp. ROICE36]|uniref:hypothetical protein n=1 Tax=Janthinobacterium sp. ROICE36 TaxID=2048670 RepID=UPI000C7EF30E|nr:hypothetical protein [Janthinobacterium sp. ROICE36]PLY41191.1 hypothetical protein CSZ94_17345 [Janthinobacterium sp. ROICE36]
MPSNKIILECISLLASAIHHVNMNARSRHIAAQVEGMVRGAQIEADTLEIKQWCEIASSLKGINDLFVNAVAATGGASPSPTSAAKETLATFADLAATVTAAAEKRFAADPFAPTFEMLPGKDAVTVKLYPRPGSVQYIVNVTGPRSSAVRMEGGLPSPILVSQVVESPL